MVWRVAPQRILYYLASRKGSFYSGIVIPTAKYVLGLGIEMVSLSAGGLGMETGAMHME